MGKNQDKGLKYSLLREDTKEMSKETLAKTAEDPNASTAQKAAAADELADRK